MQGRTDRPGPHRPGRTDRIPRYRGDVETGQLVAILLPLVAVQLALIVVALRDLARPERRVRAAPKWVWALVIVFGELLGPAIYLLAGRENE